MRMEQRAVGGMDVVFDCYNANPASMDAALEEWLSRPRSGRRVAVLGDMLELGVHAPAYHRALGERLAALPIDLVVLVGAEMRSAYEAARPHLPAERVCHACDTPQAREHVRGLLRPGDHVLLKGSRGMGLETLFQEGR